MQTETVFSITDLRYVSIDCPSCRTKVTLDMKERSTFGEQHDFFVPKVCPACQTRYHPDIASSVDDLQRVYVALIKIADRISFRGKSTETEENN